MEAACRPIGSATACTLVLGRDGSAMVRASPRWRGTHIAGGRELGLVISANKRHPSWKRPPHIKANATDTEQPVSDAEVDHDISVEGTLAPSPQVSGALSRPFFGVPLALRVGSTSANVCATVIGWKVCSQILESLESVPLLPQAEVLIGMMVTAKFTADYLGGGEGRARIESFFEGLTDRIQGIKGFEDAAGPAPSMLDVQLRSVVDEYVRLHQMTDGGGVASSVPVVPNKQSLVDALKSFVLERELKARRINSVLRRDVERLTKETDQIEGLKLIGQQQAAVAEAAAEENAYLTTLCQVLKEEKDSLGVTISELTARVAHLNNQLDVLRASRQELQQQNEELGATLKTTLAANEKISELLTSVEGAAAEVRLKLETSEKSHTAALAAKDAQLHVLRTDAQLVQESLELRLKAATEALEAEKATHEADVRDAKERLQVLELASEQSAAALADLAAKLAQAQKKRATGSKVKSKVDPGTDGTALETNELKAYARTVRNQFVDITKPWKEQKEDVAAFEKALVAQGVSLEWAQQYVRRSMAYAFSRHATGVQSGRDGEEEA